MVKKTKRKNPWMDHLKECWEDEKKKKSGKSYSQVMKAAKKTYKK